MSVKVPEGTKLIAGRKAVRIEAHKALILLEKLEKMIAPRRAELGEEVCANVDAIRHTLYRFIGTREADGV